MPARLISAAAARIHTRRGRRPSARQVSERFGASLQDFYGDRIGGLLRHPRYRLHVFTARGRHLLAREHRLRTPLGYLGAFVANGLHRRALGGWIERVVFSTPGSVLPFATDDYRTRRVDLVEDNFRSALQASCSIPFVLQSVTGIPGAPAGAYWDGGITDYHLHLNYAPDERGLVLYPHFQRAVVPGWLDKGLKWRHKATHFLDDVVLLAPDPAWVRQLPNGKLPDRNDFVRYGTDLQARVRAWSAAASASVQLAEEFARWAENPTMEQVEAL